MVERSPGELTPEGKLETLKEKGVVFFDAGLTAQERESAQGIKIENGPSEFNYYGPINQQLLRELTDYFAKLGNNSAETIDAISGLVNRIADNTAKDFNKDSVWVNVRTSVQSDEHDIPRRWHRDGQYFTPEEKDGEKEKSYKLVFTIKGPSTRFAEKIDPERFEQLERRGMENYDANHNDNYQKYEQEEIKIRQELATVIREIDPSTNEQAVLYLVGDNDAKVHAEPTMDSPRIFIQVLPGSKDQISEWKGGRLDL